MKRTMKCVAMALMAGALFTACDKKGKGEDPKPTEPPVTLTLPLVSGEVKAGLPDQIEITAETFDTETDLFYVGYNNGTEIVYERISGEFIEIRPTRISFGVHVAASFLDKTVKVYLDRRGYDKFAISDDITFTMPSVAEGYIPDPAFRATLSSTHPQGGNPEIAKCFNSYGLLDPAKAALVTQSGIANVGLNLYDCKATSLEGIELFTGVSGVIAGWGMPNIKEVDLSKWTATGLFLNFNKLQLLEKFTGSPYTIRADVFECPNLTHVDLGLSKWCYNIQLYHDGSPTGFSAVTYLDIRRQRTGTMHTGDENADYPSDPVNDYCIILPGAYMKVAANCKILVDYQFLLDKRGSNVDNDTDATGYATIYRAWKRGATIEVYNSQDITEKIGTVPMYADDPAAIALPGTNNGWTPSI